MNQLLRFFGRSILDERNLSTEKSPSSWREFWVNGLISVLLVTAFWQWRHTFYWSQIDGQFFEYGSLHLYIADMVAVVILVWAGFNKQLFNFKNANIPSNLVWSIFAVMIWLTVTALWSIDPMAALWRAGQLWLWLAVVLWISSYGISVVRGLKFLIVGAVVSAGVGIGQYLYNGDLGLWRIGESPLDAEKLGVSVVIKDGIRQLRAHGLAPHPNILGGVLVMALNWMLLFANYLKNNLVWVVPVLVAGLVWTFARGAIGTLIGGLIIIGWTVLFRGGASVKKVAGVILLALVVMLVLESKTIVGRLDTGQFNQLEKKSIEERVDSLGVWREIVGTSWMLGVGLANYPMAVFERDTKQEAWQIQPVHNIYLLGFAEIGIVGYGLIGWLIWQSMRLWWTRRRLKLAGEYLRFLPLLSWGVLGVFDHWPVSLHQGFVGLFLALALLFWREDV